MPDLASFKRTTREQFAAYKRSTGQSVIVVRGADDSPQYWVAVRKFFYRPLLAYEPLSEPVTPPMPSKFGGFQYVLPNDISSNSRINVLMFRDAAGYSIKSLSESMRRKVKQGAKSLVIAAAPYNDETARQLHQAYVEFQTRTGYEFMRERVNYPVFRRWLDSLYANHINVLAAYKDGVAEAMSASVLIGDTISYMTFFAGDNARALNASDLMLHVVRECAAHTPGVTQVLASMSMEKASIDNFYRLRGCDLLFMPARVVLNPLAKLILRLPALRQQRQKLYGELDSSAEANAESMRVSERET